MQDAIKYSILMDKTENEEKLSHELSANWN